MITLAFDLFGLQLHLLEASGGHSGAEIQLQTVEDSMSGKDQKEDPGNYSPASLTLVQEKVMKQIILSAIIRPVSLTSVPGKVMEKTVLGGIEKHLKDSAVIGHNQQGFMREKSCLSNLISFYDKVTHLADQGLEGILSEFADDTKMGGAVDSLKVREALQRDFDKLKNWAIIKHMKFNKGKYQILHLGWSNPECTYRQGNEILESSARHSFTSDEAKVKKDTPK
ncbi:rna-directed dna polymerase from mobile element jockey-like [Pitangus sulphuratus]|nr:rna-directed dna polymerase from mobile element jockey-like [Pitangus sulphuratus]